VDLIVDANILFAALIRNNKTSDLLFREELHLFTPEYIFSEVSKYNSLILKRTNRTKQDLKKFWNILEKQIQAFPLSEMKARIKEATKISPDPKDIQYFALALHLNASIWSNDKALKTQSKVKIFSTEDLLRHFDLL